MSFQTPITIRKALDHIETKRYLLPAIQREFVWETSQIEQLFDSVLRGYPIGSFLFWHVTPKNSKEYEFYEFFREYHELTHNTNNRADFLEPREVTAILDGQQRLTALNIGLNGSFASRVKWKRKANADAYPTRLLYLNLLAPRDDDSGSYEFAFLTKDEAAGAKNKQWFRVGHVLTLKTPKEVNAYLGSKSLANHEFASNTLFELHDKISNSQIINFYQEDDQDLDKVLQIFIRVNSGGTELGYSDLLLSTATAQWKSLNAREEIGSLAKQLNGPDYRFSFDKDFVMKACLVLTEDIRDIRFKVTNFNASNTKLIEKNWPEISNALKQAVALLSSFGFTDRALTSANSVLPIAFYLLKKGLPKSYDSATKYHSDRMAVRDWLLKSLLRGAFGAQGDTVLTNLRAVIKESYATFPAKALADRLLQMNRPIRFIADDLEDLISTRYGQKQAFLVLSLLYPWIDYRNAFHLDHLHPQSMFTAKKLKQAGVQQKDIEFCLQHFDDLPNLQVLANIPNIEKSNMSFESWLAETYKTKKARTEFCSQQMIPDTSYELANFRQFYEMRADMLKGELSSVLQVESEQQPLST